MKSEWIVLPPGITLVNFETVSDLDIWYVDDVMLNYTKYSRLRFAHQQELDIRARPHLAQAFLRF